MFRRDLFLIVLGILLLGCMTPIAQSASAPQGSTIVSVAPIQIAKPMATIQPPIAYLGQYKTYEFESNSDFGFNQKLFFQLKSDAPRGNVSEFQGKLCFKARETKRIIREWGQSVKGEWLAFEFEPWKKVGDVWGLGVCLSASRLREAAELASLQTAEIIGIGTQERVAPIPTHPPVSGVERTFWTNIWSCNCSIQRDLRITNTYNFPVCIYWRMKGDQIVIWVGKG